MKIVTFLAVIAFAGATALFIEHNDALQAAICAGGLILNGIVLLSDDEEQPKEEQP